MNWLQLVAYAGSFVLGIAASFLAWFLTQRIRPKYEWSREISELTSRRTGLPFHRIKVVNHGKRRLLDVTISATLVVKGLVEDAPSNEIIVPIPTKSPWMPYLSRSRLIPLRVRDLGAQELGSFPAEIRAAHRDGTLDLRTLLALDGVDGLEVHLRMIALGYDEFSGARCMIRSEALKVDAVRAGRYGPGLSLLVIERRPDEPAISRGP